MAYCACVYKTSQFIETLKSRARFREFIQKHERLPHASNSVASLPILIKFEFKFIFVTDEHEQLHLI